jgi:hypothetical protein
MTFIEYAGMSYEQASREGARLIAKAHENENWFAIIDRLVELRAIMKRHLLVV